MKLNKKEELIEQRCERVMVGNQRVAAAKGIAYPCLILVSFTSMLWDI